MDSVATVEQLIFGTGEVAEIDAIFDELCHTQLGSGVREVLLRFTSTGVSRGIELHDGRQVFVKAHQPRERAGTLAAVQRVQLDLNASAFPAPKPLAGPLAVGRGFVTVEEFRAVGEFRDTHQPTLRRMMAEKLGELLELLRPVPCARVLAGGWNLYVPDRLWPQQSHSAFLDFAATADGAEWIDALAARAKPLTIGGSDVLLGHTDWSGKHFRWDADRVSAIYDWDSVRVREEFQIVGNAAMTFTTNFELRDLRLVPAPDEVRAFLDEYSAARSQQLTRAERERIHACATFIAAYTARCEHCGLPEYDAGADPNTFTSALRRHGPEYLLP